MSPNALLLGVDGGGTQCQARLCTISGTTLGEAIAGPANIRFGLEQSFSAIRQAATQCLGQAGLSSKELSSITACLALAGATEPLHLAAAQNYKHPFGKTIITNDAHAACIGAHAGRDGGIVIVGTGSIGWAERQGLNYRVGGWGWPVGDEGSGAWLGNEALRRVLWACDGRIEYSPLLRQLFERFESDPYAILEWITHAGPRDLASLARIVVEHVSNNDCVAIELMRLAATHIDALAGRLIAVGTKRISLMGGLASHIEPWLALDIKSHLMPPKGDALDGALRMAKVAAEESSSILGHAV